MKKAFLILFAVVAFGFTANAQSAIGVRLGGGSAVNAELSFQQALSNVNRLELDLGWNNYANGANFNFSGIYQWDWNIVGGLDWFIGPGAIVSLFSGPNNPRFGLGVGGQIGLEYTFAIPLKLSLDARPMWNFIGIAKNWGNICLGVRYVF